MSSLLPVFFDLKQKPVLVIGGGLVALEKLEKLVETGATLRVIAKHFHPDTLRLIESYGASWEQRAWEPSDLEGVFLIISAVNEPLAHAAVADAARAARIIINAVDEPKASDFYFAAQLHRGPLQLAISTQGLFPGVARAIRLWLEEFLPQDITPEFDQLVRLRSSVRTHIPDTVQRMQALREQLTHWIEQGAPHRPKGELT